MPLPGREKLPTVWAKVALGKDIKSKLAKLENDRDKRPMSERLSAVWQGRSVHKSTGDVTTWDGVKLEFKLDAASAAQLAEQHAKEQAAAVAANAVAATATAATATTAATGPADTKNGLAAGAGGCVLPLAGRGTVTGSGTSCWHKYTIKFTVSGTFDLATRSAVVAKQHVDARFNNVVHYALRMEQLDGPTRSFLLTSADPDLVLRPVPPTPNLDIPEADLCKICLERAMNCILLPCAHIAICMSCSVALETCPICRKVISEAKIFFKS